MNTDKLSARLATVASYVSEGLRIADIGSDHAYLPCHLVKKGVVPFAIAGEVAEGPYQSARKQVRLEGLSEQIIVRKGDGLEVVQPGEVDCITIAGMGGALIANILEAGKDKLKNVKKLVLQPNVGASAIREWLIENNWKLTAENILKEDGKIYEVLVAEIGNPEEPYGNRHELEILFGPYLLKEKNEAFKEKWGLEKQNWERILNQLEKADLNEATQSKKTEVIEKIKMAEEVLS
ncbi:tRNA (adenine(22)-N(1))-methyltransferase TrmK [Mesobacillus maritimus]|uniref:tRNA (adenine(22)-N(1))-methyltransferase n=1 Tax=Mesobacillus maritimus TaxID=1643336 RepID=UPI00203C630C|nr:tRNA (adenine(22)-N(1))-methyltransferase TrmK [Mesobacillus maritimus]MCM3586305.1 tRNA (adenine(22)-N(1))-methyltransferase TrmK [Mesobacillus maritimus]MCM3671701.1 tRNA (adenine(22)-N(1))-methyltransferase TrmK [Mesobacillus maritimus]